MQRLPIARSSSKGSANHPFKKQTASRKEPTTAPTIRPASKDDRGRQSMAELSLLTAADYGTKTLTNAFKFISAANVQQAGVEPSLDAIMETFFPSRNFAFPQIIGIVDQPDGTRKYYWGSEATDAIKTGELKAENIIEMWKLVLYKKHKGSSTVKHIEAQLARFGLAIFELIRLHLKAVLEIIYAELMESNFGLTREDIDAMSKKIFLSVPEMWSPAACRNMSEAAKAAGFDIVEIVREPECATAFYAHHHKTSLLKGHKDGNEIIICDIGGGTGDFGRVRVEGSLEDGAKVSLRNTGVATGKVPFREFAFQQY